MSTNDSDYIRISIDRQSAEEVILEIAEKHGFDVQRSDDEIIELINTHGTVDEDRLREDLRTDLRAEIEETVDRQLEDYDGDGIGEDRVRELINEQLDPLRTQIDDVLEEVRRITDDVGDELTVEIGPELNTSTGRYHTVLLWGNHIQLDSPRRFVEAAVDAGESGSFTALLGRYDGENFFNVVDRAEVSVQEGVNTVTLDLEAPTPGEYLLTREGDFPLRRSEWNGWGEQEADSGVTLKGGSKPGDWEPKPNPYNYYYYGTKVRPIKGADALLGPSEPPRRTDETEHSTPGWGPVLTAKESLQFGEGYIRSNRAGRTYFELHEYDGGSLGVVDSTTIDVPSSGVHTINLNLRGEAGQYLLCRDYQASDNGFDIQEDGIALTRTPGAYGGFDADSKDWLTVHESGHPEFSDSQYWFGVHAVRVHREG